MDLVIVEGYKGSDKPKIEVYRKAAHEKPLGDTIINLIATVTDDDLNSAPVIPRFSPDDISGVADFICNFLNACK
jgi:molybdopterin-guanine dinucleotide biosynthesis protein B